MQLDCEFLKIDMEGINLSITGVLSRCDSGAWLVYRCILLRAQAMIYTRTFQHTLLTLATS